MDAARRFIEGSPYLATLGVELLEATAETVRLGLPYRDENSNGDKALHGGVAASLVDGCAQVLARTTLGRESGPWHTVLLQVGYLAAALGEAVHAEGRVLRRGRELVHVEARVVSESGRDVARGLAICRGRFGDPAVEPPVLESPTEGADPGPLGRFIERVPFHRTLGLAVEHMANGTARIAMPWREENAEDSGGVHEGAVLGLLDTTGAMAAWAEVGPGRFKASTPGIQARFLAPPGRGEFVGHGHVLLRDREILFSEVEIARAGDGRVVARGSVDYRIVTPETRR